MFTKAPGAYMSSDCAHLSSSPFLLHLAALRSLFPSSLALYLLFSILLMSLSNKKCLHKGVDSRLRWCPTEVNEISPLLKQETAKAHTISTPLPRKNCFGQNFQTRKWRDSFAFWVYPGTHFSSSVRLPSWANIGFSNWTMAAGVGSLWRYSFFSALATCHLHHESSPSGHKWCLGLSSDEFQWRSVACTAFIIPSRSLFRRIEISITVLKWIYSAVCQSSSSSNRLSIA